MATYRAVGSRKRQRYGDADEEHGTSVSMKRSKRSKSEAIDASSRDEAKDDRRDSLRDPDDSADDVAEDGDEIEDDENNEDEDSDDEDDDEVYSESQEPFPNHPAFDDRIITVHKDFAKLASGADACVNGGICETVPVNELRRMAKVISVIPEPPRQMIGFVGDAGLGQFTDPFAAMYLLTHCREELVSQLALRLSGSGQGGK